MGVRGHLISALGAALDGERVLFCSGSLTDSRAAFLDMRWLLPDGCEVRSTNGQELVKTPSGGSVRFLPVRSKGHRGMSVDRVYVPAALADEVFMERMVPCLATSKVGRVIGCL